MSVLLVIINAIVPIAFVVLLGVLAGRMGLNDPTKKNGVFAALALDFCLPSLLFVATATMTIAELKQLRLFLGISLGLLIVYVAGLALSLTVFRNQVRQVLYKVSTALFRTWLLWEFPC